MKKTMFYFLTFLGGIIFLFGCSLLFHEVQQMIKYSSLQKTNPNLTVLTQYGTPVKMYLNGVWKSLAIWSSFALAGWAIVYYSDRFLKTNRWINDDYSPWVTIVIIAIPVFIYYTIN